MPPIVATAIVVVGIAGLFFLDRDRSVRISPAVWIPVIWMLFSGSRPVSQWLNMSGDLTVENVEGNPLDRLVFTGLLLIGVGVLVARGRKAAALFQMNGPLLTFLGYCAVSAIWSDFAGIAFKRWIKEIGDTVMVAIVLTDPQRMDAIKRYLTRTAFLFMPISILLIKYYPEMGMRYNRSDGGRGFIGVATDKNMLGAICLFSGLATIWRLVHVFRQPKEFVTWKPLVAHAAILAMVVWLLWNANSMTSIGCLAFGTALMVSTSFRFFAHKRIFVHTMAIGVIAAACVPLFMDAAGGVLNAVGRDPTLTQRTELWGDVILLNPNAVVGAGFESFWIGPRLTTLWRKYQWRPNESHNGYLEVYLNLGWVGITLLTVVIITGYRRAVTMLRVDPELGRLKVACIVIGAVYSLTEAGFRLMHPMWLSTLMAAFLIPPTEADVPSEAAERRAAVTPQPPLNSLRPVHTFRLRPAIAQSRFRR